MEAEIWDNQKIKEYTCEMRGHYSMELDLVPAEPAEALEFGKGFHKAVEVWTKHKLERKDSTFTGLVDEDAKKLAKQAFLSVWEKGLPIELREKLEFEGNRRSYANFLVLFEAYVRKFPLEMYDEVVAVETPFTLYLGRTPAGREVSWSGVLDRAVVWQGGLYHADIKTSSYALDEKFFRQFRLSGQMTGYAWAGNELDLGNGRRFDGIMVQGVEVRIPQTEPKFKKNGEPYKNQGRKADDMVMMDIIPISEEAIEEWKLDTLQKIDDIYRARERKHWTRDRGELCNQYAGGCAFRRICEAPEFLREKIIEENFKERHWNPLERMD